MIWSGAELKAMNEFSRYEVGYLNRKMAAIELMVRGYTNNNFQDRNCRIKTYVTNGVLYYGGEIPFAVGDTIQISDSKWNKGLYVITGISENIITLDKQLLAETDILVTKVVYPQDVKEGTLNMLSWLIDREDSVGVSSESISRHSVSYNSGGIDSWGYPVDVVGFLENYRKLRT